MRYMRIHDTPYSVHYMLMHYARYASCSYTISVTISVRTIRVG
jgi:hypothetical protein